MSMKICFERVAKPKCGNFITEIPENLRFVKENRAEEWEKEIGKLCKYQYRTINEFAAGEKLFGKRPESISYSPGRRTFQFSDGTEEKVTEADLKPFYYDTLESGYVYECYIIGYLEHPYWFDEMLEEGFIMDFDFEKIINKFIDSEEAAYYAEDLILLLKAKRDAKNGYLVICRKE